MAKAVEEASRPGANIAKIAREHGLDYLAVQRRVKKLRVKAERVTQARVASPELLTRSLDETLMLLVMEDPIRLVRAAAVIRAAGI